MGDFSMWKRQNEEEQEAAEEPKDQAPGVEGKEDASEDAQKETAVDVSFVKDGEGEADVDEPEATPSAMSADGVAKEIEPEQGVPEEEKEPSEGEETPLPKKPVMRVVAGRAEGTGTEVKEVAPEVVEEGPVQRTSDRNESREEKTAAEYVDKWLLVERYTGRCYMMSLENPSKLRWSPKWFSSTSWILGWFWGRW